MAVATIAVVVAALVSLPLIRSNAEAVATAELSRFADITATSLRVDREGRYLLPPRVASVLQAEEVTAYVVTPGATDLPSGVTSGDVASVTQGDSVERRADAEAGPVIIVGRPFEPGIGIILIQPSAVAGGTAADVLVRLGVALLIGLGIAVAIALVAGARLTTPLRRASDAALRLGRGERGVHVALEGPAEIADMADALNRLAAALAVSEGRQREFLLSVSHELRTPMTSVRGYAEALADGLVAPSDVARTGEVMVAETQRLDRLVSDLLDLARLRADDFTITVVNVDLACVLADAIDVWSDRCARVDVRLLGELTSGEVMVRGDPLRLRQVIDNLAENSLRLVPAGGVIVMGARREGAWGVIDVRDSGPGLSAEDCDVAFEPGILHERYRGLRPVGTGLGLALVGRLASGMGGWARADTAPEGGAAFRVGVPLAD
ncbi:MAG: HAMP domain-containing sensor histidine kinase [Candidatus Nanopelagicales bacterium]